MLHMCERRVEINLLVGLVVFRCQATALSYSVSFVKVCWQHSCHTNAHIATVADQDMNYIFERVRVAIWICDVHVFIVARTHTQAHTHTLAVVQQSMQVLYALFCARVIHADLKGGTRAGTSRNSWAREPAWRRNILLQGYQRIYRRRIYVHTIIYKYGFSGTGRIADSQKKIWVGSQVQLWIHVHRNQYKFTQTVSLGKTWAGSQTHQRVGRITGSVEKTGKVADSQEQMFEIVTELHIELPR